MTAGANVATEIRRILARDRYQVSSLDLRQNVLGDEGAKILAKGIGESKALVHLDLSSNEMGREGADALFSELCDNQSVNCLYVGNAKGLHRNFLGGPALRKLNTVLARQHQLTVLDLGGASIGNDGIGLIHEGVMRAKSLRILNLSFNMISSGADKALTEIMSRSSVKRLDLSQNPLGDQFKFDLSESTQIRAFLQSHINLTKCGFHGLGMTSLLEACRKDNALAYLWLDECKVVQEEVPVFRGFLAGNVALRSLSVRCSGLGNRGAEAIAEGLNENNALFELYLSGNRVSVPIFPQFFA